jgi:IclR family pca regulon transcriptional regulator
MHHGRSDEALPPGELDAYLAHTPLVKLTASAAGVAALNVSANAARISVETLRGEVVPLLRQTAEAISSDIGYVSP